MGRASIKSNEPIPSPHDGPLHALMRLENHERSTEDSVVQTALGCLIGKDHEDVLPSDESTDNESSQQIVSLLSALQAAKGIKEQLQSLQTFRSKSIQQQKQQSQDSETTISESTTLLYRQVLYRVLLEWFLSIHTPMPLRRAIQANLDGLLLLQQDLSPAITHKNLTDQVLRSILVVPSISNDRASSVWQQPLHSLREALNYKVTHDRLLAAAALGTKNGNDNPLLKQVLVFLKEYAQQNLQPVLDTALSNSQQQQGDNTGTTVFFVEQDVTLAIQQSIQWAGILKTVLADAQSLAQMQDTTVASIPTQTDNNSLMNGLLDDKMLSFFESFLWKIMTSRNNMVPVDCLSNLGMAYGRVLLLRNPPREEQEDCIATLMDNIVVRRLPPLTTIAMIQGLAATAPIHVMMQESHCLMEHFAQQQSHQADPGVRLAALKGIHTLISRCYTRICVSSQRDGDDNHLDRLQLQLIPPCELRAAQDMADATLEMVLQAWENPPNRKMGNAIPALFQKLIPLMQEIGQLSSRKNDGGKSVDSNGKIDGGPKKPATGTNVTQLAMRLLGQPSNRKGKYKALETLLPIVGARQIIELGGKEKLMDALLEGIGDRNSHSAGVIADLWGKILSNLLLDLLVTDEGTASKVNANYSSAEAPLQQVNNKKKKPREIKDFAPDRIELVLPTWWDVWIPNLAAALLSTTASRRKHVASFCLPRVVAMVCGRKRSTRASSTFAAILKSIHTTASAWDKVVVTSDSSDDVCWSIADRELWALLEVTRHAHREKLIDNSPDSASLNEIVRSIMPQEKFEAALKHFYPAIRLVSFQTISPVVSARGLNGLEKIDQEIGLWKTSLPYATGSDGKEYMSSLFQCLTFSLDCISNEESALLSKNGDNSHGPNDSNVESTLVRLLGFAIDFLIFEVVVRRTAYPGSIDEKERFAIELLECIAAFAARDSSTAMTNASFFERKRRECETKAAATILEALFSRECFATIFSLLHSQWDGTRTGSYGLLCKLVAIGHQRSIALPNDFTSTDCRAGMLARGVFLASSPRQRESDTGARILAFLHYSLPESRRWDFMRDVVAKLLETRLSAMKAQLGFLLSGKIDAQTANQGTRLPLAHGLISSLQLMITYMSKNPSGASSLDQEGFEKMAEIFCRAIQLSLSVVADVKEGTLIEGMDEDMIAEVNGEHQDGTPLNVNTGAIGANGTFSSVTSTEKEEVEKRLAIQRIVMGSWLLTRETCAALSSLLTSKVFQPSDSLLKRAGELLISTLISLKHTGGAFAAAKALQQISEYCFNSKEVAVGKLPSLWANRLLDEISSAERVRNSTLRRSTGFGLGFLAIMRSEVSSKVDIHRLCPFILTRLLRLAMPPRNDLHSYFDKLSLPQGFRRSVVVGSELDDKKSEAQYEIRCRVHALNILRLIILDAPLAREVSPIIGQAIIWAVIGYYDTSSAWSVRNSSNMVFAATMLRTIDADKNAKVVDSTSSNAITAEELFKTYPLLQTFLTAVLTSEAENTQSSGGMSTPPAFPILLLLSRIQAISNSGTASRVLTEAFIPIVFKNLKARHHAMRSAAASALANLCSGAQEGCDSSLSSLVHDCHWLVVDSIAERDWNAVHGGLLGIKHLSSQFEGTIALLQESGLLLFFLNVTNADNQQQPWPPLCTSVVLDILGAEAAKEVGPLLEEQRQAIWEQVGMSLERPIANTVGEAELASTAGEILCRELVPQVWDLAASDEDHERAVSTLSKLLTSDRIDIRLYACKAFKKSVYERVDRLVARAHGNSTRRLQRILITLLCALESELSSIDGAGAHTPTLRRLSRCLSECLNASVKITATSKHSFFTTEHVARIFAASERLVSQDEWLDKDVRRETPMSGNGLEIMSFVIARNLQHSKSDDNADVGAVKRFVTLVGQLNDPNLSWRVRHSAAVSVHNSSLLQRLDTTQDEELRQLQHHILEEVLIMLQDPDPDVRSAASRASNGIVDQGTDQNSHDALVSQCVLEDTYQRAYRNPGAEAEKYLPGLLTSIQKRCQALEEKLSVVQGELKQTEVAADLDQLLNVGTERKIFEDERVNNYEEPLLANQLAIYSILQMGLESLPPDCTVANDIIRQCESSLSHLSNRRSRDLLHEATRSNSLFADIHSLVTTSAALVFLGGDGGTAPRLATEVLQADGEGNTLHPSVKRSLQVLATTERGSNYARQEILQCLFLLPHLNP